MQRARLIVMTVCLLIAAAVTGWAQTNSSTATPTAGNDPGRQAQELAALVRSLAAEVRILKLEMLKLRLESQQAKMAQLEREIEQAQKGKQRLDTQEHEFNQELAGIDDRLREADVETGERAQLETARGKMAQANQRRLYTQRQQIAQQEAEVRERLAREREQWQELVNQARQLGIKVD
jgi:chromosome segregation ATPase